MEISSSYHYYKPCSSKQINSQNQSHQCQYLIYSGFRKPNSNIFSNSNIQYKSIVPHTYTHKLIPNINSSILFAKGDDDFLEEIYFFLIARGDRIRLNSSEYRWGGVRAAMRVLRDQIAGRSFLAGWKNWQRQSVRLLLQYVK